MRKSLSECETCVRAGAKEDDDGQLGDTAVGQRARQRPLVHLGAACLACDSHEHVRPGIGRRADT